MLTPLVLEVAIESHNSFPLKFIIPWEWGGDLWQRSSWVTDCSLPLWCLHLVLCSGVLSWVSWSRRGRRRYLRRRLSTFPSSLVRIYHLKKRVDTWRKCPIKDFKSPLVMPIQWLEASKAASKTSLISHVQAKPGIEFINTRTPEMDLCEEWMVMVGHYLPCVYLSSPCTASCDQISHSVFPYYKWSKAT